jgi:hypothetical protein
MRDLQALVRFLGERAAIPHVWRKGRCCVSFALAAAAAQTGRDVLGTLPGWRNAAQAKKVADDLGGLEAAVDARYRRIAPAMARRGDIGGIADAEFGVALMIVEGRTLVGPGARGLKRLPRRAMIAAWSIEAVEPAHE